VNWSTAILYGITALLCGHAALLMMMQTVNGGTPSWWGPIMLGAAILLMVAGIRAVTPRLAIVWLAAIAATGPIAICTAFATWPLRCWIFAVALGLSAYIILKVDRTVKRGDIAALLASFLLAASWISVSLNAIRAYLSPNALKPNTVALVILLFYWVLIAGVLLRAGASVLSSASGGRARRRGTKTRGSQ
jgi:hypothetical protein